MVILTSAEKSLILRGSLRGGLGWSSSSERNPERNPKLNLRLLLTGDSAITEGPNCRDSEIIILINIHLCYKSPQVGKQPRNSLQSSVPKATPKRKVKKGNKKGKG